MDSEIYITIIWILFMFMLLTAFKTKTKKNFDSFELGGKWGIINLVFCFFFAAMILGIVFVYGFDPNDALIDKNNQELWFLMPQIMIISVGLVVNRLVKYII